MGTSGATFSRRTTAPITRHRQLRRPPSWLVAAAILVVPLAVAAARVVAGHDHAPFGDVALIELRTRDVLSADHPLLGSYSRYGFNHPGPLWFYALAMPYRLTGDLAVGAVLVGALSLAAMMWVAARRGGLWFAAAMVALLVFGAGADFVTDPWEPHGLLLPTAALLLLTFDTVAGRPWSLPIVVATASLLAQAQATLLPYAVAMGVLALWSSRRAMRPIAVAALLVVVLWAPPMWQQLTGDQPNLTQMVRARDLDVPSLGVAGAWDAVAINLGHRPPWVGVDPPLNPFDGGIDRDAAPLLPIGALALAVALVWRRTPLAITVGVAAAAAVVGMSQLLGPLHAWIPEWLRVIGWGAWLALGWSLRTRLPRAVLIGVALLATSATTARALSHDTDPDHLGDAVRALVAELPPLPEPVLARSSVAGQLAFSDGRDGHEVLVLELDKLGVDTVVTPDLAHRFGDRRAEAKRAGGRTVLLADEDDRVPPGFRRVAFIDPLPRELRHERNALLRELGLDSDATAIDVVTVVHGDMRREPAGRRLLAIPSLPRLALLVGGVP